MKTHIDIYFTVHYDNLYKLATARAVTNKRPYDPAILVSNCYEYLIDRENDIPTKEDIQIWAYKFITSQAAWHNSKTNREMLHHQSPLEGLIELESYHLKDGDVDEEIKDKLFCEYWYHNRRALLSLYKKKIKHDRVKVIIVETMEKKQTACVQSIANHFNIPYTAAWLRVKEIKEEIRAFEQELKKYDEENNI